MNLFSSPPTTSETPGPLSLKFSGDYSTLEEVPSVLFDALDRVISEIAADVTENGVFSGILNRSLPGTFDDWSGPWSGTLTYRRRVFQITESQEGTLTLSPEEWTLIPGPVWASWTCGGDSGVLDEIGTVDSALPDLGESFALRELLEEIIFDRIQPEVNGTGGFGTLLLFPQRTGGSAQEGQPEPVSLLAYLSADQFDPERAGWVRAGRVRELLEQAGEAVDAHGQAFYEDVQEEEVLEDEEKVKTWEVTLSASL